MPKWSLLNSLFLLDFYIRYSEYNSANYLIIDKDTTDYTNDLWNSEKISSVW